MSDEDQEQITDALAERVAVKKQQLGLHKPAAGSVAESLTVEGTETVTCRCGKAYTASVLRTGAQPIAWPSSCESCRARKEQAAAEEQAATAERQLARAAGERRARLSSLAIPPKYAGVSLETFEHHGTSEDRRTQMRVLSWARRYLAQWPDVAAFVAFQGGYGTGKGHVAWALARAVVEQLGGTARFVKLPALVRELRDTWRRDSGLTYQRVLRSFTEPDLLVIDEASRHAFYGDQVHQHLYDVIDTRIDEERPTILTTNEDDAGLAMVLRGALVSRLEYEGGIVPFGTASWRSRPQPHHQEPPPAA